MRVPEAQKIGLSAGETKVVEGQERTFVLIWFRECSSILDFSLVDFGTGFVDHDYASARAAVVKIDGDLMGDQIGSFPGVVLVLAIEPDRVLETNTIGNVKMKNGHWDSSSGVNTPGLNLFRNLASGSRPEIIDGAKVPAIGKVLSSLRGATCPP
jgi:hypothetical protein